MKTITVSIEGTIRVVCYCNKNQDWSENYQMTFGFDPIETVTVQVPGKKEKGIEWEYYETSNVLKERFGKAGFPLMVGETQNYITAEYPIELEDNEKFDPKKVFIRYSTEEYSSDGFSDWIDVEYIMYGDKLIHTSTNLVDLDSTEPEFEIEK